MKEINEMRFFGNSEILKIVDPIARDKAANNAIVIEQINTSLADLEFSDSHGGKNLWDEEWENGYWKTNVGSVADKTSYATMICNKNLISIKPNEQYYFVHAPSDTILYFFDAEKKLISYGGLPTIRNPFTTPNNCKYFAFRSVATTYNHDMAIIEGTSGTYKPYIPSVKMLAEENKQINSNLLCLNVLGYEVPEEVANWYIKKNGNQVTVYGTRVDIGKMWWDYSSADKRFYSTDKYVQAMSVPANNIDGIYAYGYTPSNSPISTKNVDKAICLYGTSTKYLFASNFAYTDATAFGNAMKGNYIYAKLAQPYTITLDGNEAIIKINDSLADQGLIDVFNGEWESGDRPNNTIVSYCHTKPISVKGGDIVTVKYKNGISESMGIGYKKTDGTYSVYWNGYVACNKQTVTIPSDAVEFFVSENFSGASASNHRDLFIYKNNEIDEIKADLSSLIKTLKDKGVID